MAFYQVTESEVVYRIGARVSVTANPSSIPVGAEVIDVAELLEMRPDLVGFVSADPAVVIDAMAGEQKPGNTNNGNEGQGQGRE